MPVFVHRVLNTPLGPLALAVAADESVRVRRVMRQLDFAGILDVDRVVGVDARWAGLISFCAAEASGPIELQIALPQGVRGSWSNGECLAAKQFTSEDLELLVGGGDVDFLAREIAAGRMPARWNDLIVPDRADNQFGVTDWIGHPPSDLALPPSENGISWRLPSLEAGETVSLHFAVAWARGNLAETAAWFAVDLDDEEIHSLSRL